MSGNRGLNGNQNHNAKSQGTTKILQPPGGTSSLSLWDMSSMGNSSKTSYQTTSSSNYSAKSAGAKPPAFPPSNQRNNHQEDSYESRPSPKNVRRRNTSEDIEDSLDTAMSKPQKKNCNIPGLESHYNDQSGNRYASDSGKSGYSGVVTRSAKNSYYDEPEVPAVQQSRSGAPQKMSAQEYAAALKAQINAKSSLSGGGDVTASIGSRYRRDSFGSDSGTGFEIGGGGGSGSGRGDRVDRDQYNRQQLVPSNQSTRVNHPPGGRSSFKIE